jgi:hypothetical protein
LSGSDTISRIFSKTEGLGVMLSLQYSSTGKASWSMKITHLFDYAKS